MDKSIGLFFGTFDPLHNGHVSIAKYFLTKLNLDKIWLVITPLVLNLLYVQNIKKVTSKSIKSLTKKFFFIISNIICF